MEVGEIGEVGAYTDYEVKADSWTSGNDYDVAAHDGVILGLFKTSSPVKVTARLGEEVAECEVNVIDNTTNTRFRHLDMAIGSAAMYTLDFLVNGEKVPNNQLTLINTNPDIIVLDKAGNVTGKGVVGEGFIICIYNGKKYGHHVKILTRTGKTIKILDKTGEGA